MEQPTTLIEAKAQLNKIWEQGGKCPCCNQHVKLYKRKFTSSIAIALYNIYILSQDSLRQGGDGFIHVENEFKNISGLPSSIRGNFSLLRFWGLIEKKGGEKEDGNPNNGYYRATEKASRFIRNNTKVSEYLKIYNNTFYGFDGEETDFFRAIGTKFNFSELIKQLNPTELFFEQQYKMKL